MGGQKSLGASNKVLIIFINIVLLYYYSWLHANAKISKLSYHLLILKCLSFGICLSLKSVAVSRHIGYLPHALMAEPAVNHS